MSKYKAAEHICLWGFCALFVTNAGFSGDLSSTNTGSVLRPAMLDEFLSDYGINGSNVVYTMRSSPKKTVLDGPFAVFGTNDAKIAAGSFRDDKLQGDLFLWHPNGKLSAEQHFENGNITGTETYWNTNGVILRTTEWKVGDKNGLEVYWDKRGKVSLKIEWKEGFPISAELFQGGALQKRLTGTNAVEFVLRGSVNTNIDK
jgi:hypothetical protein